MSQMPYARRYAALASEFTRIHEARARVHRARITRPRRASLASKFHSDGSMHTVVGSRIITTRAATSALMHECELMPFAYTLQPTISVADESPKSGLARHYCC